MYRKVLVIVIIQTILGTYRHLNPNMNREVSNRLKDIINAQYTDIPDRKLVSN